MRTPMSAPHPRKELGFRFSAAGYSFAGILQRWNGPRGGGWDALQAALSPQLCSRFVSLQPRTRLFSATAIG